MAKSIREIGLESMLGFGAYKDWSLQDVIDGDIKYVEWALGKSIFKLDKEADKYYLSKIVERMDR